MDLGATLAGKTVQVRFRIGSDEAASELGWQIDNIGFEGITGTPFPSIKADAQACLDHAPIAKAGPDAAVQSGASVTLDGSKSSDPDGDELTYLWSQVEGPTATLTSNGAKATFTAPTVDKATTLVFSLQVTANGQSSTDTVTIVVEAPAGKIDDTEVTGGGCGCAVPGDEEAPVAPLGAIGALAIGLMAYRRRSSKR